MLNCFLYYYSNYAQMSHYITSASIHTRENPKYSYSLSKEQRKHTFSRLKVFVRAKAHPASKARRIMGLLVVGGALANPKGFKNFSPHISTLKSTKSMGVMKAGKQGIWGTSFPHKD